MVTALFHIYTDNLGHFIQNHILFTIFLGAIKYTAFGKFIDVQYDILWNICYGS